MAESAANRRLAKNSLYMSIQTVVVLLITLYTTRVILKVLGVEDYGVYNVVAGFVSMFAFLNSSMSSAVQRYFNYELGKNGENRAKIVYNAAIRIHIILAIILVIVSEPVGLWYINNKMVLPEGRLFAAEWIFHFCVASLFINVIIAPYMAAVMAHEKMGFYAIVGIIDSILKLGIVVALPYLVGDRLIWYGLMFMGIAFVNFVCYFSYCKIHFKEICYSSIVPGEFFKDILSFSGWSVFGSLAYMLREQGVNIVLNFYFGTIVNAARGVANQVSGALQSMISSIVTPSRPQVIQEYSKGNLDRAWSLTYTISKFTCLFFLMMALPICMEINSILHIWLGDTVPEHTASFIVIILVTNTFGTLVAPISTVMHATGKIKFYQIISSLSNLMSVPLGIVFLVCDQVPEYVFWALFITMWTNLIAGLISAVRYADLKIFDYLKNILVKVLLVIIVTIPLAYIPILIFGESIGRCIIEVIWCIIIVAVSSYYLALSNTERVFVNGLISRFTNRSSFLK